MTRIDELRAACERAERDAQQIMAEKDAALSDVRERFNDRQHAANLAAAEAQKAWMDAEAAAALVGRDDAEAIARNLGLTLPT